MFILHTSNCSNNLLEHLNYVLDTPLSKPLATEQFLIQSQGMQRWVCQQLAEKRSVWANFNFHYPGKFFASLVDSVNPENKQEALDKESLLWQFDSIIRALPIEESEVIYQYLNDNEQTDIKRYQLAKVLANLFDQYQFMRPEWFEKWHGNELNSSHSVEVWQRYLWQVLEQRNPSETSLCRGLVWQSALDQLTKMTTVQAQKILPERLCVFGINAMSPLYMRFLKAVSQHIEVHFYLLNPTKSYWADIPTLKAKLLQSHDEDSLHTISNPILSSLGQQGRDFQQLILETGDFELEIDSFSENDIATLLAQIKNDILHNTDATVTIEPDTSLQIHCCHSHLREVEVIRDQVLECFANNAELTPRDIIVMAPDIQPYSAYIGAVFDTIPHSVADRSIVQADQPIGLFLEYLGLCQGRWELEPLLEFLENTAIYGRLGLVTTDLDLLRYWLEETRIRWGESAEHRESLGFPDFAENTWQAALDRMLMGFMQSDDSLFCMDILPFNHIEGQQGRILGKLIDFFSLLSKSRKQLAETYTLLQWSEILRILSDELILSTDDFQKSHSYLTDIITQLGEFSGYHDHPVTLKVIQHWLQETADSHQSAVGFMRGQLTFCSMLPMRAIPSKVIILMGMNESEFPHADRPTAFDLMANDYRVGDKSYRNDERYQILEVILSAEEQLIISYIGQSQHDNTKVSPSIVITELLDTLNNQYGITENQAICYHPLHKYNAQYFAPQSTLFSYHKANLAIANIITNPSSVSESPWWQGSISHAESTITLDSLFQFYKHPQRYFIEQQLKISLPFSAPENINTENFAVNTLNQYQIDQDWVSDYLQGQGNNTEAYLRLKAEGKWPSGEAGKLLFTEKLQQVNEFSKTVKAIAGQPLKPQAIDLEINGIKLTGYLTSHEHTLVVYRYANLKVSDYIQAWLSHCLYNSSHDKKQATYLLGKNEKWIFEASPSINYLAEIEHYLSYFVIGQQYPCSLYLKPALAYQEAIFPSEARRSSRSTKSPLDKAQQAMTETAAYEPSYAILYPESSADNFVDLIDQSFVESCKLLDNCWVHRYALIQ